MKEGKYFYESNTIAQNYEYLTFFKSETNYSFLFLTFER